VLRIGLTGGIGAGKSLVAARLSDLGAVVIDADRIAREVVEPGTAGLTAVVEEFGPGVLAGDGFLDRAALGALVFTDEERRRRLNELLHPLIAVRTAELMAQAPPEAVVVHDVPLLVEKRMGAGYHLVIVVAAPDELRLARLERRGMDPADARARIATQATDTERRAAADIWLDNVGSPGELRAAVQQLWAERIVPFAANLHARSRTSRPEQVTVVPPVADWPVQAARLLARVDRAAVGEVLRADHVGSTAVPGLPAKDVIDLQLVVTDLATADRLRNGLEEAGFARLPGEWRDAGRDVDGPRLEKRLHMACDPGRPVNLHVRVADGPAWRDQLIFRDWLRAHPGERDGYTAVKLTARGIDIEEYTQRKGPWITTALERARTWAMATGWVPDEPDFHDHRAPGSR
jgi:dephospho-CoA kinase